MSRLQKWPAILGIVILLILTTFIFPESDAKNNSEPNASPALSLEIENIKNAKSTQEQAEWLTQLLETVGPVEAQEQMLVSGLPFTGETHLLIHVIGDYIYDKFGPEGLPLCRDYFLSACYHGFIINTLADYGLKGMAEAMVKCRAADPGVSAQCAHAAGHGFVAWHDYDLIKAAEMCDELGKRTEHFPHFNCYDGVFMENIWGVHGGKPSEKRWVKPDDIYYPCNDERIPERYLSGCWANQATLIYQYYQGNLKKTAEACDGVADETYRDTCYDNLARQIHPLTQGQKERVMSLCANATGPRRQEECLLTNMAAFWSVGDRVVPFELCAEANEPLQGRCFERLISLINYYLAAMPEEKMLYCHKIPIESYRNKCKN
jgi:hypothetical protein